MSRLDPVPDQSALRLSDITFPCREVGCLFLRRYEGGRPPGLSTPDECPSCGCPIVVPAADKASIKAIIDKHLL